MSLRFHHVGILVTDMHEAATFYSEMLGLTPNNSGTIEDPEDVLRLLLIPTGGCVPIELILPTSSEHRFYRCLR